MDTYSFLRELADSWFLLAMFLFFTGSVVWLWRPGGRTVHDDAAGVIFRHDDAPLTTDSNDADAIPSGFAAKVTAHIGPCGKNCAGCDCGGLQTLKMEA